MAPLFKSYVQGKILNTPIELHESQSKALLNTRVVLWQGLAKCQWTFLFFLRRYCNMWLLENSCCINVVLGLNYSPDKIT